MSTTETPGQGPDPLFDTQLTATADRPFNWSPKAKPLGGLRTWLNVGLIFAIAGDVLMLLGAMGYLALEMTVDPISGEPSIGYEPFEALFGIQVLVSGGGSVLFFLGFVLTAIFHSRLVYRATKNLILSKARNIDFSAGWAVGCHFVPFVNLVVPPEKIGRIWEASHAPTKMSGPGSSAIGWWWGTYIVGNIIANISLRVFNYAVDRGEYDGIALTYWMDILSSVLTLTASFLLLRIHHGLDLAQQKLSADTQAGPAPSPST